MSYAAYDVGRGRARAENQTLRDSRRFSETMTRLMREKEISQHDMADRTGLSVSYISMLVMGKREPTLLTQHLIANALGVKRLDLYATPAKDGEPATE